MHTERASETQSNERSFRRSWFRAAAMAVLLVLPAQAFAVDSALVRSLIVPGLGQAQQGHYTRSAVFAGAAVVTGVGVFLSQIYYREAVNKLYADKHTYAAYEETLENDGIVSIDDMEATYESMEANFDSAENRLVWRNAFLIGFAATYAINLVDVLVSKPYDAERETRLSVEMSPAGFKVAKTFRF